MILGMNHHASGRSAEALGPLESAVAIARACGYEWARMSSTWGLMKAWISLDEPERAIGVVADLQGGLEADRDVTSWVVLLHTTAAALAVSGRGDEAAVLLGGARSHGGRVGFDPSRMDPVDGPREARQVEEALPPSRLAPLLAEGAALSRDELNDRLRCAVTARPSGV
jgi:hypothetical protein